MRIFAGSAVSACPRIRAIEAIVREQGLPIKLFEAIVEDNKQYETTVFEGMRL